LAEILTPGRWRGLQTTSTDDSVFTIVAFDQRGSYKRMLPEGTAYNTAVEIKSEVVHMLSREASALLLDADYGMIPAAKMSHGCGLLLSLEQSGYTGDSTYRRPEFDPKWTVADIKRVGAEAVKLLVYYHPDSGALADELDQLMADIIAECNAHDIPLFIEPMSYSLDANVSKDSAAFAETKVHAVVETARRLSALKPDVLKMEFPVDDKYNKDHSAWQRACEQLSQASSVPWVLLSAGVDFETFRTQTEIACKAGASGFLAGRAIWKESVTMSPQDRAAFLEGTALERLSTLNDLAARYARPWTDFYSMRDYQSQWYRR
jgi:tagatose 1,6-diphosphate aldolase